MKNNKKLISFRLDRALIKKLKLYCIRKESTIQDVLNELIHNLINKIGGDK